jgi:hypothetical protein
VKRLPNRSLMLLPTLLFPDAKLYFGRAVTYLSSNAHENKQTKAALSAHTNSMSTRTHQHTKPEKVGLLDQVDWLIGWIVS